LTTNGGTLQLNQGSSAAGTFQAVLTGGVPCPANQSGAATVDDVQGVINEALGAMLPVTDLNGDGVVNVVDVQTVTNAALGCGVTTSGITPAGFSTRIP